jgi:hypothetical protein
VTDYCDRASFRDPVEVDQLAGLMVVGSNPSRLRKAKLKEEEHESNMRSILSEPIRAHGCGIRFIFADPSQVHFCPT